MDFASVLLMIISIVTILSIISKKADKTKNMLIGGSLSMVVLIFMKHAPYEIVYEKFIKWDVLVLIIFLTVFVDILDKQGYFEYIGIHLVKLTKGNQLHLFLAFGVMMFLMSAFLDNVTAIILLSSLTITVCKRLEINPTPHLIYQTFLTGVGALLTPVGSVPNIILNSGAHIGFNEWLLIMLFYSILAMVITSYYFYWLYRSTFKKEVSEEKIEELAYLDPNQVIKSKKSVYISTALILFLVIGFVSADQLGVGIEQIAVLMAIIAIIAFKVNTRELWKEIDWATLFFFSSLFVVVGALDYSGALLGVTNSIASMMVSHPSGLLILLLLLGGLASTALNNIPVALVIASIFGNISASTGHVAYKYWFSAVIATNVGASLTPIGSVIVIIVFEVLRKSDHEIDLGKYFIQILPLFIILSLFGFLYLFLLDLVHWI